MLDSPELTCPFPEHGWPSKTTGRQQKKAADRHINYLSKTPICSKSAGRFLGALTTSFRNLEHWLRLEILCGGQATDGHPLESPLVSPIWDLFRAHATHPVPSRLGLFKFFANFVCSPHFLSFFPN
jgi:hypothetical protein